MQDRISPGQKLIEREAYYIPAEGPLTEGERIDIGQNENPWETAVCVATVLADVVSRRTNGLSLSIGIGPNKLLARLVSGIHKPRVSL